MRWGTNEIWLAVERDEVDIVGAYGLLQLPRPVLDKIGEMTR